MNIPKGFFEDLENTRPFLKMCFQGFAGSGKTYTAGLVAKGLADHIGSNKPILFYYTERAGKGALAQFYRQRGIEVKIRESRSLIDLTNTIRYAESGLADIVIIDSITHVWETFLETYRAQKNRRRLTFADWGVLKPKWKREFSDVLVESKVHIIFTGRAGWEYEHVENDGQLEISKSGVKMSVEKETPYEPDILVHMERQQDFKDGRITRTYREAQILKDRTTMIDGQTVENPDFKFFLPAIEVLLNGEAKESNIEGNEDVFPEDHSDDSHKRREVLLDKIKANGEQMGLGTSKEHKKFKADMIEVFFGTNSWAEVQGQSLAILEAGVEKFNEFKQWFLTYDAMCKNEGIEFDIAEALRVAREVNSGTSVIEQIAQGNLFENGTNN